MKALDRITESITERGDERMKITLPDDVKKIIETLEENGYEG